MIDSLFVEWQVVSGALLRSVYISTYNSTKSDRKTHTNGRANSTDPINHHDEIYLLRCCQPLYKRPFCFQTPTAHSNTWYYSAYVKILNSNNLERYLSAIVNNKHHLMVVFCLILITGAHKNAAKIGFCTQKWNRTHILSFSTRSSTNTLLQSTNQAQDVPTSNTCKAILW